MTTASGAKISRSDSGCAATNTIRQRSNRINLKIGADAARQQITAMVCPTVVALSPKVLFVNFLVSSTPIEIRNRRQIGLEITTGNAFVVDEYVVAMLS